MIIYDNSKNTLFRYDEYVGKIFRNFLKKILQIYFKVSSIQAQMQS